MKQTESRTRLEVDRLQDANTEILDKLSRLAPQVKEIREEVNLVSNFQTRVRLEHVNSSLDQNGTKMISEIA